MAKQQQLIELCNWIEPKIRELGWHCAATGSALYGREDKSEPEDLDIVLYRHHGYGGHLWRPFDVLLHAGFRNIEDCSDYPEFEGTKESNPRKVFKVKLTGWDAPISVDFLCFEATV